MRAKGKSNNVNENDRKNVILNSERVVINPFNSKDNLPRISAPTICVVTLTESRIKLEIEKLIQTHKHTVVYIQEI